MPTFETPAATLAFEPLLAAFRREVDAELDDFLTQKHREALALAPEAAAMVERLLDLVAGGGKRLRPALVHFGYLACGGRAPAEARPLALATELLHAYLLVHDDIMDHADTRRGRPTAHVFFAGEHRERQLRGDADEHGRAMAILVGDLAASYALELFHRTLVHGAAEPASRRAALASAFAAMSQEVVLGQYLEILAGVAADPDEADLRRVLQLKSGRYSVERPLELGALLAGASPEQLAGLAEAGRALGEAFQLQDDLLGLFGDAETVGKPVGGDLVEGKFTFLVFHAMERAGAEDRAFLARVRGQRDASPEKIARALWLIETSGARRAVEEMIAERVALARRVLAGLTLADGPRADEGKAFLDGLVDYLQERRQ